MIKVGVVGFGLAGRVFHAPFIQLVEGFQLAAIMRRSGEPDPAYSSVHFVRTVDELLADKDIQLVVVATPNDSHYSIACQCLEAGRHVVVDKPFTPTLKEAEELVALAKKQQRIITVFQNRRWDGDFKTVKKIIADGSLGRIVIFETHFDRFRPNLRGTWHEKPVPGMGLLFDLAPHLIDQALVLFGTPQAITADLRKERDGSVVDDAFDITFHYPRLRALLRASPVTAAPGPRYWICGTTGTYTKYGLDPQEDAMKAGGHPTQQGWGTEPEASWGKLTIADGVKTIPTVPGNYRGYYENVRDAILGKAKIAVTPEQALNVMRAMELAIESSAQRRTLDWPS
ncbi:MAG TPA: oxidoreductase [Terriglobales bacterium]|nr:oxidoreductase [Terriglobales bacterium]